MNTNNTHNNRSKFFKFNHYPNKPINRFRIRETLNVKSSPCVLVDNTYATSAYFIRCCVDCTPNSKVYYEQKSNHQYFLNLLEQPPIPATSLNKFKLTDLFGSYALEFNFDFGKNFNLSVQKNEKIKDFVQLNLNKLSNDKQQNETNNKKEFNSDKQKFIKSINDKILMTLNTIEFRDKNAGQYLNTKARNNNQIKFIYKFMLVTFSRIARCLFDRILCYEQQLNGVQIANQKLLPIVYMLDKNATLFDQLLVQLCLYLNHLRVTNILSEISELFSKNYLAKLILRYLNVKSCDTNKLTYFHRFRESKLCKYDFDSSELNGTYSNDEPIFYKTTFLNYLSECLKNDVDINMKLENSLLNTLTKLIETEDVYDVLVVPVAICHEKKPRFLRFFSTLELIKNTLFSSDSNGQLRINFSQPYSLREFIETCRLKKILTKTSATSHLKKHLKYELFHCKSIMSTNITAFILTNQFSRGCNLNELCKKFLDLEKILEATFQIGFNYETVYDAVSYSLCLLKNHLVIENSLQDLKITNSNNIKNCKIKLRDNKYLHHELIEYSQTISKCLFMHSIIACSIISLLKTDLHQLEIYGKSVLINENELVVKSIRLINLFKYEFDEYKKPCETIHSKVFECINFYLNSEILVDYKSGHSRRLKFYNSDDEENLEDYYSKQPNGDIKKNLAKPGRFDMVQSFNTDSESDPDDLESNEWRAITILKSYHLKLTKQSIESLRNFKLILSPYLDGYLIIFNLLRKHMEIHRFYSEKDLMLMIDVEFETQLKNQSIKFVESTIGSIRSSALKYLTGSKIMAVSYEDNNYQDELREQKGQCEFKSVKIYNLNELGVNKLNQLCLLIKSFQ